MSMGATLTIFLAILLLSITNGVNGGYAAPFGVSGITVNVSRTGSMVEGQAEYAVTVSNKRKCSQSNVFVKCFGLHSVEPVDLRAIKPVDASRCIVNEGKPIPAGGRIKFKYAWKTPQDFPVLCSQALC